MTDFNLSFRPSSYFEGVSPRAQILSSIKGANRRAVAARYFDAGREADLPEEALDPALTDEQRRRNASLHPAMMGGEYLPDLMQDEVEIARLTLASTMRDVTSIYAERTKHGIHYRVVDEHDGLTLGPVTELWSKEPLTLGEIADFLMEATALLDTLGFNADGGDHRRDYLLGFSVASSDFYPDLGALITSRVEPWLEKHFPEIDEDQDEDV
jgi:hypothetical protein